MRRLLGVAIALTLGLAPARVAAGSAWGSPSYGDPPGWCTNFSDMWVAKVVTNDPHVGTNPEQDTFYGFHPNPGYDDWYGYFYGDFRGSPGDSSGWVKLLHETYPHHYHWNFATNGWAVHGHAKEYIAYYNWTFGGQCGLGTYGSGSPPAFMADQYGYPVVDIYVDSVAPFPPQPRVIDMTTSSVTFTWDPVADQGDGSGQDYFVSGMDHYTSWLTIDNAPGRLQFASSVSPRAITQVNMTVKDTACIHVEAFDTVQNATPEQVVCAGPLEPPPMPSWSWPGHVLANPTGIGLVGLDSWFWLAPQPTAISVDETYRGIRYVLTAVPTGAGWDFGDGSTSAFFDGSGFGQPYPSPSTVTHTFQAHLQAGYEVRSEVRYYVTWTAIVAGRSVGPYPMGSTSVPSSPLLYPVEQAQPELTAI